MELHESLILERYRLAIEQQRYFTGAARNAFATYAKFVAGIAAVALTLTAARESLGLDRAMMPDIFAVLAAVLAFLAAVATIQIVVAVVRWRRFHQLEATIDPDVPRLHPLWWLSETIYGVVIIASAVYGWRILETLANTVSPA